MSCFKLIRRISACLLFVVCLTALLPVIGAATSASISLSGNEGAIPLRALASFTNHEFCNSSKPPACWHDNSGTLRVTHSRPNGYTSHIGSNSGNGSAEWSTILDGGVMAQGTHTFAARACDSKGICHSNSQSITIDNTPEVSGVAGGTAGDLDINGTVTFKERVGGYEGHIELWHVRPNGYRSRVGYKYFEGTGSIAWSWPEIVGSIPDAGGWAQGDHTVQVIAIAANGSRQQINIPISIDNTPEVSGVAGGTAGDLDINGTVTFKERVGGYEGHIELWHVRPNGYRSRVGYKYFEGTGSIAWSWPEIVGSIPDAGGWAQGDHTVQVIAIAANGSRQQINIPINIDNTPEVSGVAGGTAGDLDINGTVTFKERVGGYEGHIELWHVRPNGYRSRVGYKYFEGTGSIAWSWPEIVGSIPDAGGWAQGDHTVQVIAIAANGSRQQINIPISIDNTPEVSGVAGGTAGDLDINGTVTFKERVGGYEGHIELWHVRPNGYRSRVGYKYFEGTGSIAWSWPEIVGSIPDAGGWAQGDHTVQVIAIAANGSRQQINIPISIDNTPEVSGVAGGTAGDLDINGTVTFKERVGGYEGHIELWHVRPNGYRSRVGYKYFEGTGSIAWSWPEIVGSIPDAGGWAQGDHTVQVIAIAANGSRQQINIPISIDNTPEITIIGPRYYPDLTFDIIGTVFFKEHIGGNEGSLTIALKEIHQAGYTNHGVKSYAETSSCWSYSEVTGSKLSSATWGTKELMVQITARANNGATATVRRELMIPALGCPAP
jgi:hypothetical protein